MDKGNTLKKNIVIGLTAHVDAGKTTLSESLLKISGALRKPGRVDHGDSFLDYYREERERGLTIFSKPALFNITLPGNGSILELTLLDTPGHTELQGETERALMVMDYCIFILSAPDGITEADNELWDLIKSYEVPTFIFINKMDRLEGLEGSKESLMGDLKENFGEGFVDIGPLVFDEDGKADEALIKYTLEDIASLDEETLNEYLRSEKLGQADIRKLISKRSLFPVIFGAALKDQGIRGLLKTLSMYTDPKDHPADTRGLCFKVSKDPRGRKLTYLKLDGGSIHPKDILTVYDHKGSQDEKVALVFSANGPMLRQTEEIRAGEICVLTGIDHCEIGYGVGEGAESDKYKEVRKAAVKSRICLNEGVDAYSIFIKLNELLIEFPEIKASFDEKYDEINVLITGRLMAEVLKTLMKNRYDVDIDFMPPKDVEVIDKERTEEEAEFLRETPEPEQIVDDASNEISREREDPLRKENEDLMGAGLKKDEELLAFFDSTLSRNAKKTLTSEDKILKSRRLRGRKDSDRDFNFVTDPKETYIIVDGYNIIFAWEELSKLARNELDLARKALSDILANYQAYKGINLILVYDAYKVKDGVESVEKYHGIFIIYTKEAETADSYIERTVHDIAKNKRITVVTNDNLEQTISFGQGAMRMTANELKLEIKRSNEDMYNKYLSKVSELENRMKL